MIYDNKLSGFLLCFFAGISAVFQAGYLAPAGKTLHRTTDSSDSVSDFQWSIVSRDILPQWRDGIATIVRGKDMYIIGGWKPRSFPKPFTATTNEIWISSDGGISWKLFANADFTPRHTFICIDSEDGYVYVIGGDQYNDAAQRSEVWRSKNLRNWELVSRNSPFGSRMLMAGVEYKGDFYVGGGQDLPDFKTAKRDFYKSEDKGVTWKRLSGSRSTGSRSTGSRSTGSRSTGSRSTGSRSTGSVAHLGKNIVGTMAVFNDKIYQVSGGWYGGDSLSAFTYSQDVYSTTDGINWSLENPMPMPGVQYPNTVVFDKKLWCVGGSSVISGSRASSFNKNDLCYMDASGKWTLVRPLTPGPTTHASSLIPNGDHLLLVMGNELNGVFKLNKK